MKKLIAIVGLMVGIAPVVYGAFPITGYVQITTGAVQSGGFYTQTGTVQTFTDTGLPANQCVQTGAGGLLTTTGGQCGSGSGGGASTLQVTQNGVQITSPTASINFYGPPFILGAIGSTSTVTLNPSSVTLQGNTFNGVNQLVQTNGSSQVPVANLSNTILNQSALQSGAIFNTSSGTITGPFNASTIESPSGYTQNNITVLNSSNISSFTAVGVGALSSLSGGGNNIAVGNNALNSVTIGVANTAVGFNSMEANIGNANTAIGSNSLSGNVSGNFNTVVGNSALRATTGSFFDTCVGEECLSSSSGSSRDACVGWACLNNDNASDNVSVGYFSGITNTNGTKNILIGSSADVGSSNLTNAIAIGANAKVNSSNTAQIGGTYGSSNAVNLIVSSATISGLQSGQCVQAGTGGLLTTSGAACGVGSGGGSSLQTTLSGVQITSPTASLNLYNGDFQASAAGTTAQIYLNPNTTDFIHLGSTLQSGATFYVSSGTVQGPLTVNNVSAASVIGFFSQTSGGAGAAQEFPVIGYASGAGSLNQAGSFSAFGTATTNNAITVGASNGTNNHAINISNGDIFTNSSAGTSGQVLTSAGAGAVPTWSSASGGVSVYPATATASFPFGLSASTISVSTVTVTNAIQLNGSGNLSFVNTPDGLTYQVLGSSMTSCTTGQTWVVGSSNTAVCVTSAGGGSGTFLGLNSSGNTLLSSSATFLAGPGISLAQAGSTITVTATGSGTPTGPNWSVQIDSNGAFGGLPYFTADGSSVTITASSLTYSGYDTFIASGVYFNAISSTFSFSSGTVAGQFIATSVIASSVSINGPLNFSTYQSGSNNITPSNITVLNSDGQTFGFTNAGYVDDTLGYKINNAPALIKSGNTLVVGNSNAGSASGAVCIGDSSCGALTSAGTHTLAIGNSAMLSGKPGPDNMCIGALTCQNLNLTSTENTAVGTFALGSEYSGSNNVAIGWDALHTSSGSVDNTCIGWDSCDLVTTGGSNVAVGDTSMADVTTGFRNTCVGGDTNGFQPCQGIVTGSSNTALGAGAAGKNFLSLTGAESANTLLGYAASMASGVNKSVCIGYNCVVSSSNTVQFGGSGVDAVVVNVSTVTWSGSTFATLPPSPNGTIQYCADCTVTTAATCTANLLTSCVCAGSGPGAFAKRLNNTWYCN